MWWHVCNSVDYFGIMYSEVIFILAVVLCMCERLTPDTLSTQTEAQDDAHRRAPILRHKASKSNWISTIFPLLPTKNTSVDYETHGKYSNNMNWFVPYFCRIYWVLRIRGMNWLVQIIVSCILGKSFTPCLRCFWELLQGKVVSSHHPGCKTSLRLHLF